ncbi:MAG: glycosyl transferase family 2, partial [Chloroflexi bacterium]|nr:glycosyl transferase family 2 [Chloroflexota bacterium]
MTFLTIFTAPKPFTDPHINIIQRNAIQSWMHLSDEVEVILIGEEDGLSAAAAEFNLKHLPEVTRNNWNTPLVSSIFDLARAASDSPVLAYINADILLM